jgi:hypothetical protein
LLQQNQKLQMRLRCTVSIEGNSDVFDESQR